MAQMNGNLDSYFTHVQAAGNLHSPDHARSWSTAAMRTLGFHLDRSTKKALSQALPADLAYELTRVFWLLHFRNPNLPLEDFLYQVARRSGNTDVDFARFPTTAVFGAVKQIIDQGLANRVAASLSPEVRTLWQQA